MFYVIPFKKLAMFFSFVSSFLIKSKLWNSIAAFKKTLNIIDLWKVQVFVLDLSFWIVLTYYV